MRLVDADALRESIITRQTEMSYEDAWALTCVDNAPAVDARENVHGEWIKDIKRFGEDNYHCSVCGAVLEEDDVKWRNNYFCYHCGAKMRKVGDAE